jgi:hypothetical protein
MSDIKPGEIIIKDANVLKGLMEYRFEPVLIEIIAAMARDHGIVITESYRPKKHINDLHGTIPVRAIDARSWCYPDKMAYEIRHEINTRWIYDPNRPDMECAIIHQVNGGAIHFHIQVSENTRRRAA